MTICPSTTGAWAHFLDEAAADARRRGCSGAQNHYHLNPTRHELPKKQERISMSAEDDFMDEARVPLTDDAEDSSESLTDWLDQMQRAAFLRSLAHREPPKPAR